MLLEQAMAIIIFRTPLFLVPMKGELILRCALRTKVVFKKMNKETYLYLVYLRIKCLIKGLYLLSRFKLKLKTSQNLLSTLKLLVTAQSSPHKHFTAVAAWEVGN